MEQRKENTDKKGKRGEATDDDEEEVSEEEEMGKENENGEELHGGKGEEEEIENGEELHGGENEESEGKEFIMNYDDDLFLKQKATLQKKYKNY